MRSLRSLSWAIKSLPGTHDGICFFCRRHFSSGSRPGIPSKPASYSRGFKRRNSTHSSSSSSSSSSRSSSQNGSLDTKPSSRGRITDPDLDPTLPERFRAVMRQMPHPVVIITTLDCPPRTRIKTSTDISSSSFPSSSSSSSPAPPPSHWTDSDVLDSRSSSSSSPDAGRRDQLRPIPRAMTVSSFTSLSLRPRERVLFNIALPSRTYHAIFSSGRFNAHVLASDAHGARLADLFTKGYGLGAGAGDDDENDGDGGSGRSGLGVLAGLGEYGVEVAGKSEWDAEWDSAIATSPHESAGGNHGSGWGEMQFTAPLLKGRGILHVLKCDLYTPRYLNNRPTPDDDSGLLLSSALKKEGEGEEGTRSDGRDNFAIMLGEVTEIVHGGGGGGDAAAEGGGAIALAYADGAYRMPGKQVLKHAIPLPKR